MDTPPLVTIASTLFGLVGGGAGLAALYKMRSERARLAAEATKLQAEAAEIIQRTAAAMVAQYAEEVRELRNKITQMEKKLAAWQRYYKQVVEVARAHNLEGRLPNPPPQEPE